VVGDGEEDADVMQKGSASSKTWSASPISSCVEVKERLEETAASGVVDELEPLQF
jgi:hypothetical protein